MTFKGPFPPKAFCDSLILWKKYLHVTAESEQSRYITSSTDCSEKAAARHAYGIRLFPLLMGKLLSFSRQGLQWSTAHFAPVTGHLAGGKKKSRKQTTQLKIKNTPNQIKPIRSSKMSFWPKLLHPARPWIFLCTLGEPSSQQSSNVASQSKYTAMPVGLKSYNTEINKQGEWIFGTTARDLYSMPVHLSTPRLVPLVSIGLLAE